MAEYVAQQWAILREHGLRRDSKGSRGAGA